jgi:hypothetical protein
MGEKCSSGKGNLGRFVTAKNKAGSKCLVPANFEKGEK